MTKWGKVEIPWLTREKCKNPWLTREQDTALQQLLLLADNVMCFQYVNAALLWLLLRKSPY